MSVNVCISDKVAPFEEVKKKRIEFVAKERVSERDGERRKEKRRPYINLGLVESSGKSIQIWVQIHAIPLKETVTLHPFRQPLR